MRAYIDGGNGFTKMTFQPKPGLAVSTINRILQLSVGKQLTETGNISSSMFDFIDQNKYMVSDNRSSFINATSKNALFQIEKANLPYDNWIQTFYRKLFDCSVYTPFLIIEKFNIRRSAASMAANQKRKFENMANGSDLYPGGDDDSAIEMDFNQVKKRRVDESLNMLNALQRNIVLDRKERLEVMRLLKANTFMEFVDELNKEFDLSEGEARMKRMSCEQRECLNSILQYAYPDDFLKKGEASIPSPSPPPPPPSYNPFYKIFLIEGSAGCGKSSIIENLNFYTYSKHKTYSQLLYVTQTNVLCQSMRNKCSYNDSMQYLTFFRFLSVLNLNFHNKKKLLLNCDAMKIDAFQNTCGSNFLHDMKKVVDLPQDMTSTRPKNPRLFIIFDEIYAVSHGKMSLFLFVVRCLKLQYPSLSIYCILIGDKQQLRPFIKLENIKLEVVKTTTSSSPDDTDEGISSTDETTMTTTVSNTTSEDDTNVRSLISHSESLTNATKFILDKQFRISDTGYNDFVNMVRHCDNTEADGIKILEYIAAKWPEKINNNLTVIYPIAEILETLGDIDIKADYKDVVIALDSKEIWRKTIDTIVFCFTNRHSHYYTLSLAMSYQQQLTDYQRLSSSSASTAFKVNDFIAFSLIYNYDNIKYIVDDYKIKDLINNNNYLINILPLIRYCPYKILLSKSPVARLSIVYLLDWVINEKNIITHLVVFSAERNLIFTLLPSQFEMNLFKNINLFGFPIQLAFSSTFASSQGLTLESKIAVSCFNISKAELYVCLTRIKKADDLVRIY